MQKMMLAALAAAALAGCASSSAAPDQATIRGNYKRLAACVYQALDPQSPGNFHLTDLGDKAVITFETSGGGMTFRGLKATFLPVAESVTTIEIDGPPPGYYPSQVRPLAEKCAGH